MHLRKMRFSFYFVVFANTVVCVTNAGNSDDDAAWTNYKLKHGKDYSSPSEDAIHKEIFLAHRQQINQHNNGESPSYRQELNRFSDMRPSEKSKYLGLKASMAPSTLFMNFIRLGDLLESRQALPVQLDYRSDICMAAIKDQGSCGSCWAFAAVTPIEFNYCKKHKQIPIVLSEQQLVDCDKRDGGCNGGWYTQTWKYIKKTGGIVRDSMYPYTALTQSICPIPFWFFLASARVFMFSYIPVQNAVAMQVALKTLGPLAVAFAVADSYYSYVDGVYDATDCDNVGVNHAMVIVGWGNQGGIDYWIVRNSWGTGWGKSGYVLIQRGVNKCQIEAYSAFVLPF